MTARLRAMASDAGGNKEPRGCLRGDRRAATAHVKESSTDGKSWVPQMIIDYTRHKE